MKAEHITIGNLGEGVASKYLSKNGHSIIDRNYRVGYGEIDIISKNEATTHFIEVKTVTRETNANGNSLYRPEENMHPQKVKILFRTIERYLMEHEEVHDWQLDLVTVELHVKQRKAVIRYLNNIS